MLVISYKDICMFMIYRHYGLKKYILDRGKANTNAPGSAILHIPEPLRREKVKKVEKLLQVVLQRSSCQQQFVLQRVVVQDPEKLQRSNKKKQA